MRTVIASPIAYSMGTDAVEIAAGAATIELQERSTLELPRPELGPEFSIYWTPRSTTLPSFVLGAMRVTMILTVVGT